MGQHANHLAMGARREGGAPMGRKADAPESQAEISRIPLIRYCTFTSQDPSTLEQSL